MDKVPYRPVIHLEATIGEFGDQPTQGELALAKPLPQPNLLLAPDRFRFVPAHLAGRHAPGLPEPAHPGDRGAYPDAKPRRRCMPRQTPGNRTNHPFTKIDRIRLCHPCWPPPPASMLNQISRKMGIPLSTQPKTIPL